MNAAPADHLAGRSPHPRTGQPVSLELHTDRADRVAALVLFHENPEAFPAALAMKPVT